MSARPLAFSANLGFLWPELPFLDRIGAAAAAGFDALEFHDQAQGADPLALSSALAAAGLPVAGLNARMGETAGRAAIPGEEAAFRADLAEAEVAAALCGAGAIHVLAGRTEAPGARETYIANLRHALAATPRTVLIEPICRAAMPGYFLHDLFEALGIVAEVAHPRLKILFDCFHVETEHGDCPARFRAAAPHVGHVQIAAVPDRGEPDRGAPDYAALLPAMRRLGHAGPFGAEYRPRGGTDEGLGWMAALRAPPAPADAEG